MYFGHEAPQKRATIESVWVENRESENKKKLTVRSRESLEMSAGNNENFALQLVEPCLRLRCGGHLDGNIGTYSNRRKNARAELNRSHPSES